MSIVAAAGLALASDRLAARIDAAHVRTNGTAQSFRIARSICVYVFIIVHLVRGNSSRRAIRVGRQDKRNAIAPSTAHFGRKQFRIDFVFVRLQKLFKSNYIRLNHFEDSKTAIEPKFPWLRHQVIFRVILQDEKPGFAGLLVIGMIFFRAPVNGGHADAVCISKVNSGSKRGLAILHFDQCHPVGAPNLAKPAIFGEESNQIGRCRTSWRPD